MLWLVGNCCGIACVILAWFLLAYAQYSLLTIVLIPQPDTYGKYANIILFELVFCATAFAHFRTTFTDPGSVPRGNAPPEPSTTTATDLTSTGHRPINKCRECQSIKPPRAHHCSICKRCIRKMDHHCPWVNNCVGERNQKYFVLCIFYVGILSIHSLVLASDRFMGCLAAVDRNVAANTRRECPGLAPMQLIMLYILLFLSLLFSVFAVIMFCAQIRAIWTDWTAIENLKKEEFSRTTGCENFKIVFGDNYWLWLSPFTSPPAKANEPNSIEP